MPPRPTYPRPPERLAVVLAGFTAFGILAFHPSKPWVKGVGGDGGKGGGGLRLRRVCEGLRTLGSSSGQVMRVRGGRVVDSEDENEQIV
eukprot:1216493-Amorphochlora_amoeboformis.AAC.2